MGAPDDAEAAATEPLEQAVAVEHKLLGVGRVCAARDAPARGLACRELALTGRLDEGAWRLHRLPRSPRPAPVPAAIWQEKPR